MITAQTDCPAGEYSYAGDVNCRKCPGGHSCANKYDPPTVCAEGKHSAYGSDTCTDCAAGTFCPAYAVAAITCPDGTYSDSSNSVSCKA